VPWINNQPSCKTYNELCLLLNEWRTSPLFLFKARYKSICNVSRCLSTNAKFRRILAIWRGRDRDLWQKLNSTTGDATDHPDEISQMINDALCDVSLADLDQDIDEASIQ
jgi:hypothetical protein